MRLSAFMARSSATIDFSRPTNSGITICGYTTTSRSGSTGIPFSGSSAGAGESGVCSSLTDIAFVLGTVETTRWQEHEVGHRAFQGESAATGLRQALKDGRTPSAGADPPPVRLGESP